MKTLKVLSFLMMIIIVVAVISTISNYSTSNKTVTKALHSKQSVKIPTDVLQRKMQAINELANQSSKDNISDKEYNQQISGLLNELNDLKRQIESYKNQKPKSDDGFSEQKFWIKLVFSCVFSIAALYVVLSQKYKDDVRKWAFSVLTLIAGVWIGTI
jgi:hypothetical protein